MTKRYARNFEASEVDRFNLSWAMAANDMDGTLYYQLEPLRARSRQMYANNAYMKQFVRQAKKNIIGHQGLRFQSRKKRADGSLDQLDNDAVERAFDRFSRRGAFDVTGRLSRWSAEQLLVHQLLVDGEYIVRLYPSMGPTDYAIQIIDPALLDHKLNEPNPVTGNEIRLGIEIDTLGRPVAYHFHSVHPTSIFRGRKVEPRSPTHERVPAEVIIHDYLEVEAGQTRGIPAAHAAILGLKNLGEYRLAAILNARAGANKHGFWKTSEGGRAGSLDDELQTSGDLEYRVKNSEPGEIDIIDDPEAEFVSYDPTYPHSQFAEFNTAMLQGIAAGLGTFYASMSQDYSRVNLSSMRGALVDERDSWRMLQRRLREGFHDQLMPVWLRWMLGVVGIENSAGVRIPPRQYDAFLDYQFRARGWPSPDPLKDAQAASILWSMGAKTLEQISADIDGTDWEDVVQQIARERQTLTELGIEVKLPTFLAVESEKAEGESDDSPQNDESEDDDTENDEGADRATVSGPVDREPGSRGAKRRRQRRVNGSAVV